MKERDQQEPTIIEILNESMRRGTSDPDHYPTVEIIAERMGIDFYTLTHWLKHDNQFKTGLLAVKQALDSNPWKDTSDDDLKLDAATLSFGIVVVLEETKKRYTV